VSCEWCQWWKFGVTITWRSGPSRTLTLAWLNTAWKPTMTMYASITSLLKPST
jgi:hypothetical protein